MYAFAWLALLAVEPFWEAKPAAQWSEDQLQRLLSQSPWAQVAGGVERSRLPGPPVVIYLASATPMQEAEAEVLRRRFKQHADAYAAILDAREEYQAYLREQAGKVIVVGVPLDPAALADGGEAKRMKDDSQIKVGKKKVKSTGHFPPTPNDPVLRLIFPRPDTTNVKEIEVELYLPSIPQPYRQAVFPVKDLMYRGRPEL